MKKNSPVILLDGDILKNIVGGDTPMYDKESRLARSKRYSLMCKMLSDQGINVIICALSMFDEIREWNRENLANYIEIFLDVSMEVLKKRNKKGLYLNSAEQNAIPGLHYEAEFPKNPDIVLNTDGSISIQECVNRIQKLSCWERVEYNKDTEYWNEYYKQKPSILNDCSSFAKEALNVINTSGVISENDYLLDLGCGNGRDSLFFAKNGIHVVGIDASDVAIDMLEQEYENEKYL